jgi:hypothetical protein
MLGDSDTRLRGTASSMVFSATSTDTQPPSARR